MITIIVIMAIIIVVLPQHQTQNQRQTIIILCEYQKHLIYSKIFRDLILIIKNIKFIFFIYCKIINSCNKTIYFVLETSIFIHITQYYFCVFHFISSHFYRFLRLTFLVRFRDRDLERDLLRFFFLS